VDTNTSRHHGELEFAVFEPLTFEDTTATRRVNTRGFVVSPLQNPALPPAPVPAIAPTAVGNSSERQRSTQTLPNFESQIAPAAETSQRVMENTSIGYQLRRLLNGGGYGAGNSELSPTGYRLRRLLNRGGYEAADSQPSIQNRINGRDPNSNNTQRSRTGQPMTGGERCSAYPNLVTNLDRVIAGNILRNREARSNSPPDPTIQQRSDIGGIAAYNNRETNNDPIQAQSLMPFVAPETWERALQNTLAHERGELIGHPNVAFRATHNVMLHYFFNDLYSLRAADLQRYARCANFNPNNEPWASPCFIRRVLCHLSIHASVDARNRAARIERARTTEDAILQLAGTSALSDSRAYSDNLSAVSEVPHVWESRREEQGEAVVFAIAECVTCDGFELQLSGMDNQDSGGTDPRVSWARLYCWAEQHSRSTHRQLDASLHIGAVVSEEGEDEEGAEEQWQGDEYWEQGENDEDNDDMNTGLPRWPRLQPRPVVSPPMHRTHR
jgi:hypothetical protein